MEVRLDLWSWQAGLDQKPTKPGFHRRFRGSRKRGQRTQSAGTMAALRRLGVATQSGRICEPGTHRHVDRDQGFDGRPPQAESGEGKGQRCRA